MVKPLNPQDFIDQKFNYLIVKEYIGRVKQGCYKKLKNGKSVCKTEPGFRVLCLLCGNQKDISLTALRRAISCGCEGQRKSRVFIHSVLRPRELFSDDLSLQCKVAAQQKGKIQ